MKSRTLAAITLLLGLIALYLPNLPNTVQFGDTGELVRSAYMMEIPHPSGYPLFILFLKLAISALPFGTVFWKAAFATSLIAASVCAVLFLGLRKWPWVGLALAACLATSEIFWRYAELPDVFALNALFASVIAFLYLDERMKRFRDYIPLIFLVALAHHLTIIFMFPLVAHVVFQNLKSKKQWIKIAIGFAVFASSYLSLMLFHPDSLGSWGQVDSVENVIRHFLRSDYGSFKLIGSDQNGSLIERFKFLFSETANGLWAVLITGFVLFGYRIRRKMKFSLEEKVFSAALLSYALVFFAMSNVELEGFRVEVFTRFLILFHVLLCIWASLQYIRSGLVERYQAALVAVLIAGCILNVGRFWTLNNFSQNTILEDFAINFLNTAALNDSNRPVVAIVNSDTRFYTLQYVQEVLRVHPDVLVTHWQAFLRPSYTDKLIKHGLTLDAGRFQAAKAFDVESDFVLPNLKNFAILTNFYLEDSNRYQVRMAGAARLLLEGRGTVFYPEAAFNLKFRSGIEVIHSPTGEFDSFRDIWNEYGAYYWKFALVNHAAARKDITKQALLKTLQIVPWFYPAQIALCDLERESGEANSACLQDSEKIRQTYYAYFH